MPRDGLRQRKKQQTRKQIRRTAVELFLARGFDEVSVADVASAAGVSKMTVFNYFPAKEDLFFEGNQRVVPDLAEAVRRRGTDESPVRALRRYVRSELESRAEWTGLHDGVAPFVRLVWTSPTLLAGTRRRWQDLRADLVRALEEVAGLVPGGPDPGASADSPDRLVPQVMAGQVLATVEALATANQLRQAHGTRADDAAEGALAACELAFDLLEFGLGAQPLGRSRTCGIPGAGSDSPPG